MTTGVVTSVTPRRAGGALVASVLSTDTVLPVDDAADFDEEFDEPRFLVIGEETVPRQYIAVENDEEAQQSVTLAAPVGGSGFSADDELPVTPWDPESPATDKRAVEFVAWVRLDEQGNPIPAEIPHELIPLSGAFTLVGASVRLEESEDGQWGVANILGREAQLDPASVATPFCAGTLASDFAVPTATWTTLSGWTFFQRDFSTNVLTPGVFYIDKPGRYLIVVGIRWRNNATGRRGALSRRHTTLGVFDNFIDSRNAEATAAMSTQSVSTAFLAAGDAVSFQGFQNSGASLDTIGGETLFSITWVGAGAQ